MARRRVTPARPCHQDDGVTQLLAIKMMALPEPQNPLELEFLPYTQKRRRHLIECNACPLGERVPSARTALMVNTQYATGFNGEYAIRNRL